MSIEHLRSRREHTASDHLEQALHRLPLVDGIGQHAFKASAQSDRVKRLGRGHTVCGMGITLLEHDISIPNSAAEPNQIGCVFSDTLDLRASFGWFCRDVDTDDTVGAAIRGKAHYHSCLRAARRGTDDDEVKPEAAVACLLAKLFREAYVAQAA